VVKLEEKITPKLIIFLYLSIVPFIVVDCSHFRGIYVIFNDIYVHEISFGGRSQKVVIGRLRA